MMMVQKVVNLYKNSAELKDQSSSRIGGHSQSETPKSSIANKKSKDSFQNVLKNALKK